MVGPRAARPRAASLNEPVAGRDRSRRPPPRPAAKPEMPPTGPAANLDPVVPPLASMVPVALLAAWAEIHARLTEATLELVDQQVRDAEASVRDLLRLATELGREHDPARRLELQVQHARETAAAALARADDRCRLVVRAQIAAADALARRAESLVAAARAAGDDD